MSRSKALAVLVVLALVAGACDSSDESSETTTATAPPTTAAPTTTTTPPPPTTTTTTIVPAAVELPEGIARVHYHNPDGDYTDWVLHLWMDTTESVTWEAGLERTGQDDFGLYWDVGLTDGAANVGFIIHRGDEKDPGPDQILAIAEYGRDVYVVSGDATIYSSAEEALGTIVALPSDAPPLAENAARIHYFRPDGDYPLFRLHVWEDTTDQVTWEAGLEIAGQDGYGVFWDVTLADGWERVGFIVHRGDEKDPGPDMFLVNADHGREIWVLSGSDTIFTSIPDVNALPQGDIGKAQAFWVNGETILWTVPEGTSDLRLYHSPTASLELTPDGLVGGEFLTVTVDAAGPSDDVVARFPHLAGLTALTVDAPRNEKEAILRGQFAVAALGGDGAVLDATGLQIPGVLDAMYATEAPLGATFARGVPTLSVWAPTARSVRLQLFNSSADPFPAARVNMSRRSDGVWSVTGDRTWTGKYYLYEVEVFAPTTGAIERNLVTDPYSHSLGINSRKSQIVDLADDSLKPLGWDDLQKPVLDAPEDIVLYELHVRDFSAIDESVPADLRGTYKAFTLNNSAGMRHLGLLADAGLTHVHLLPVFDIATIDEDRATWQSPGDLAALPVTSDEQQAAISAIADLDGFNWGYDPFHYTVPEGSYSTNPDGATRILEFREMVQSLNETGLRVVVDVVYNHTNASGQGEKSVLDRIVPGYYHRLDAGGNVATSTCCANTATEHDMMRRLMVDSVVTWARHYRVDGFRFDLMGHHMRADMVEVRAALDAIDPSIYVYGEGWDFGEVGGNARGVSATQLDVGGLGIGTFNDRVRDAVRGGSPFGGLQEQGFATGLFTDPNATDQGAAIDQAAKILQFADQIRVALAGNLAAYSFTAAGGNTTAGSEVDYNGAPTGYTADPQEVINYVSAHDNETFFDIIQTKAPLDTDMDERGRIQSLGLDIVAYGQGIPFFHAGSELLRSKSLDKDSYNSGDWFNALDFTYQSNGWARGLPVADKNADRWELVTSLFGESSLMPSSTDIRRTLGRFVESLEVRASSPLFRLRTADDIVAKVSFANTGIDQVPGLIVMVVDDTFGPDRDANRDRIIVVFNASTEPIDFELAAAAGAVLHPVLADSIDPVVRNASVSGTTLSVPARTAVVFEVLEG